MCGGHLTQREDIPSRHESYKPFEDAKKETTRQPLVPHMDCGKQKTDAEYYVQPDDPIGPTGLVIVR